MVERLRTSFLMELDEESVRLLELKLVEHMDTRLPEEGGGDPLPRNPSGRKRAVVREGRATRWAALFEDRDPNRLPPSVLERLSRAGDEEGGDITAVHIKDPSSARQDARSTRSFCDLSGRPWDWQSSRDLRTERHDASFAQPPLKDAIMALRVLAVVTNALTQQARADQYSMHRELSHCYIISGRSNFTHGVLSAIIIVRRISHA